MKTSIIAATLLSSVALAQERVTGRLGDADIRTNNPLGVSYQAVLPERSNTNIRGQITGTSNENGTGVVWNVNFYGFPDPALGPFIYHIHDQPVPSNGNCTATRAHLDPYERGEQPPCDPTQPQTCQVGDLSGKFGNITASNGTFQDTYLDLYTATEQGPGAFFGNRSVVVHTANTTRLTCANFTLVAGEEGGMGGGSGSGNGSATSTMGGASPTTGTSPPITSFTGAAATTQKMISAAAIVAGLAAFAL